MHPMEYTLQIHVIKVSNDECWCWIGATLLTFDLIFSIVSLVSEFEREELPVFTRFFINGRTQLHSKFCRQIEELSDMGTFSPLDEKSVLNKLHPNTVSEATNEPKTITEIAWIAPKRGSGCVFISAIPYNNGKWYKDLENLFQIVCENTIV